MLSKAPFLFFIGLGPSELHVVEPPPTQWTKAAFVVVVEQTKAFLFVQSVVVCNSHRDGTIRNDVRSPAPGDECPNIRQTQSVLFAQWGGGGEGGIVIVG